MMKKWLMILSFLLAFCLLTGGALPVINNPARAEETEEQEEEAGPEEEEELIIEKETGAPEEETLTNAVLKVSAKSVSIKKGDKKKLTVTFLKKGKVTISIKNKNIVSASLGKWKNHKATLTLKGKKAGSTTITIKNSYNKEKITIKVTVKKAESSNPVYRALLIGEKTFSWEIAPRNEGDVRLMSSVLGSVYTPSKTRYKVTKKIDATYSDIQSLIKSTFSGTKNDDVSLFFIATHGNSSGDGELSMPRGSSVAFLSFSTLASWLNSYVKGKVIVILESCGAGSAIYSWQEQNGAVNAARAFEEEERQAAAFTSGAIKAFSAADPGIIDTNSTGDFRTSKYYVLAASRHRENSHGNNDWNWFTRYLTAGIWYAEDHCSYADQRGNKDGKITLTELYSFINAELSVIRFPDGSYQHVQRYPVGSKQVLFRTK